ncbi:MAG TPA: hypothetical protein VEH07_11145 [Alphaproteobacteria bacterium]|nr:hypothetical protein [Alphaproteobacteria bacterium]
MKMNAFLGAASLAFLLCVSALPSSAANTAATTAPSKVKAASACSLLTQADIQAAVGAPIGAGTPSTDTVCTWMVATGSNASVKYVTLQLNDLASYDGGQQVAKMSSAVKLTTANAGSDGSYYLAVGNQVGLVVKKGLVSFKVAVYATVPVEKKEAMELPLAQKVVGKI